MSEVPAMKRPRRKCRDVGVPDQNTSTRPCGPSDFDSLPVELLQSIFEFAGPRALLALQATAKHALHEAADLAWTSASLSAFGHLQLAFTNSNIWYSNLPWPSSSRPQTPGSTALVQQPVTSGKRKHANEVWQTPTNYENYLRLQLHTRLFRGLSSLLTAKAKQEDLRKKWLVPRIPSIPSNDEVRYLNLSFDMNMTQPLYLELLVDKNSDNLSLSIVDFADGGSCSVTFSPDAGAVIKERKIRDKPRQVTGSFFYPLKPLGPETPRGNKYLGRVGVFIHNAKLSFFRRPAGDKNWQTTGFCVNLRDACDKATITPCLAFRDKGVYSISVAQVSQQPPIPVPTNPEALANSENVWQPISWAAGH